MQKYKDITHMIVAVIAMLSMMWFAWMKLGLYVLLPFVLGALSILSWTDLDLEIKK